MKKEERESINKDPLKDKINKPKQIHQYSVTAKPYTINYVTEEVINNENELNSLKTSSYNVLLDKDEVLGDDTFPQFLNDFVTYTIPKGIKRRVSRLPKNVLLKIDPDEEVAIEKCCFCASNLTSTLFLDNENISYEWKPLKAEILHEQLKRGNDNTRVYRSVLDALQYSTNGEVSIIKCLENSKGTDTYEVGVTSKKYGFNGPYQNCNVVSHKLKTPDLISKRRKFFYMKLAEANDNVIGKNLIEVYSRIDLPNHSEILTRADELIQKGYRNKKGKLLTKLNKRRKNYYSDFQNRSFVEDNINQFQYLTTNGYMIPIIGGTDSGGRVVDSFNLMPSWIRMLCRIDGMPIVELDFTALHPNIAMTLFGGSKKFLTHEIVAESLKMDVKEIKKEHLSFFNRHQNDMLKSILYNYYKKEDPEMLFQLIEDKKKNGYKNTSKLLFKREVEIMGQCISELNRLGIYVLYVYDALYCKEIHLEAVKEIMNRVILENGVYTKIKESMK